jgi:hypothetical protein
MDFNVGKEGNSVIVPLAFLCSIFLRDHPNQEVNYRAIGYVPLLE